MKKTHSLTSNSLFYLFYNLLNAMFPFITGIYVAHILLPGDIGQVEAARNLAQYFSILAFLGIPTYALREISKARNDKNELNKLHSELFIINFISTFIFLSIYLFLIFSVTEYRNNWILYCITGGSIALNFLNNSWLFEGLEKFSFISIRNFVFKCLSFVLLVLLVKKQDDYLWYALITVIGTAGNYLINIISSKKIVSFQIHNLDLRRHLKPIFFLVAVNLAIEIYSLIDVTMLNVFTSKDHVAFYSYGIKIHKILIQILNTFTMVLVPKIALFYKEKRFSEFNDLLTKALKVIILLSIPAIVGIWFVSDFLIVNIYGQAYASSSYVLKVLSFGLLISPVGYLLGSRVMLVSGNERKMLIPVWSGAIINIFLNLIFIQLYAEVGAAIASVVGEVVVCSVYITLSHSFFHLDSSLYKKFLPKCIASIAVMTFVLLIILLLDINALSKTILQISGSIIVYFSTLLFLKEDVCTLYLQKIKKKLLK